MISNLSKDASAASISAEEAIENAIACVVEEEPGGFSNQTG
jgi:hypothetical protein